MLLDLSTQPNKAKGPNTPRGQNRSPGERTRHEVYAAFHMGSAVGDKSIKLLPGKGYDIFQALFFLVFRFSYILFIVIVSLFLFMCVGWVKTRR